MYYTEIIFVAIISTTGFQPQKFEQHPYPQAEHAVKCWVWVYLLVTKSHPVIVYVSTGNPASKQISGGVRREILYNSNLSARPELVSKKFLTPLQLAVLHRWQHHDGVAAWTFALLSQTLPCCFLSWIIVTVAKINGTFCRQHLNIFIYIIYNVFFKLICKISMYISHLIKRSLATNVAAIPNEH